MSSDDRTSIGLKGRIWAISNGFTKAHMCENFTKSVNGLFETWVPRNRVELIDAKQSYNLIPGVL